MRWFHEPEPDKGKEALTFALGAAGGLALGLLLLRRLPRPERASELGRELRDRARGVAGRLRPQRMRRQLPEQRELMELEDRVLQVFYDDEVLSERGIDVGAISQGIIELSGSVWTEEEADRAVRVANGIFGVRTVVNRMEIEDDRHRHSDRRSEEEGFGSLVRETSRVGGMGVRRQSPETDPDRPDDSRVIAMHSLDRADRDQQADEGYMAQRREGDEPWRKRFSEDEVEPQDPHGKHAPVTLDEQQQERNTTARVGDAPKPAEHLALEQSDVPVKPHSRGDRNPQDEAADE